MQTRMSRHFVGSTTSHTAPQGTRFLVRTARNSLKCIRNLLNASGGLALWRLRISVLDYDVAHGAVVKHQAAETLLKLRTDGELR